MTGQLFGHYRVLDKIGSGGMGEVFRARDERLDRDVALKLVRPASTSNPDHLRRFEQEARAAAALAHPNIVAIYDFGLENGVPFIVSELLEGETLRRVLARGPLPVPRAIEYTLQIVRGLIAAGDRRIVHRDLKPENLFVTRDGRVKILDFGVAKLQSTNDGEFSIDTMTTVTKAGALVGTVAYMSPEQLRGKSVDHRSDIFSTGTILYEMLSGHRAFQGETEVDTMTAVLREEPAPIDPSGAPGAFQDIVRHCLEKEPENRFQSARDLAFALETLAGASLGKALPIQQRPRAVRVFAWVVAGAILAAAFTMLGMLLNSPSPAPVYQRLTFEEGTIYSARFTPDGRSIVYAAAWNNKPIQLYSTVGNSLLAQPLNFGDANLLAISPANELALALHSVHNVSFETQNGVLARAPMAGGSPRELMNDVRWADWDSHGELAVVHRSEGESRIEYPRGRVLYQTSGWVSNIRFSPKGTAIAFINHPIEYDDRGSLCLVDFSGKVRTLSPEWESADGLAWRPDGKEIWFTAIRKGNNRNLMAVDLSGHQHLLIDLTSGLTLQDIGADGRVLITLNSQRLAMSAAWLNAKTEVDLSWHDWNVPKDFSPDDQSVLFEDASEAAGAEHAVAIRKIDGTLPIHLGPGSAGGLSPDGKWAISLPTDMQPHLTLLPVGPGQPRQIEIAALEHIEISSARFAGDGKNIVINGNETGHAKRGYLLNVDGGMPRPITPEGITAGLVSPDSRYVIGYPEIALYPLQGGSLRAVPGLPASFVPEQWSEDSSALYGYHSDELPGRIYKVDIATGKESLIYQLRPLAPAGVVSIAPVVVSRDGSHFAYSYNQTLSTLYLVSGVH